MSAVESEGWSLPDKTGKEETETEETVIWRQQGSKVARQQGWRVTGGSISDTNHHLQALFVSLLLPSFDRLVGIQIMKAYN